MCLAFVQMRHGSLAAILTMLLLSTSARGQASQCLVDLDDQDHTVIGHTYHDRTYTKTKGGVKYYCTSMCDHCCTSEAYCCDPEAKGQEVSSGGGSAQCLEDESNNKFLGNCGFRMLCCPDKTPPPQACDSAKSPTEAQCKVDLDDQDHTKIGQNSHESSYTKKRGDITYYCTSMCDHCCVSEPYCCDVNADIWDKDGSSSNSAGCLENEIGNIHMANCGFKMICCPGSAFGVTASSGKAQAKCDEPGGWHGKGSRPKDEDIKKTKEQEGAFGLPRPPQPPDDDDDDDIEEHVGLTFGFLAVALAGGAIGGVGVYCCWAKRVGCFKHPPQPPMNSGFQANPPRPVDVTVVGNPVEMHDGNSNSIAAGQPRAADPLKPY